MGARPLLLYDADCGFCRRWVGRWRALTGGRVEFEPAQDAAARAKGLAAVPAERLKEAVCLVEAGRVSWGAEAVFRCLSHAPRRRWLLRLYESAPPFAAASEALYRLVARNRRFFSRLTLALWGEDLEPPAYLGARWLFVKALSLCYLAAFASLAVQVEGLIGSRGILPAAPFLRAVHAQLGAAAYRAVPGVFWLSASDAALKAAAWAGTGLSIACLLGFFPGPCLLLLWALYLSFLGVGQDFLGFQWDVLLVEAGFLALFLAPWGPRPGLGEKEPAEPAFVWLLRWLLFRLMFESGCVKLLSGDKTWRSLTALYYHFETQPLPTPLAWYAHRLPRWLERGSCAGVFFIELLVPWLIFLPRRPRLFAFFCFVFLQTLIALTGNYTFFNLLAAALALSLLDDSLLRRWPLTRALMAGRPREATAPGGWRAWAALPVGALALSLGALQLGALGGLRPPRAAAAAIDALEPFHLVDSYGLFAVMTTTRDEISLEVSADGRDWKEWPFLYKPGDPRRRPGWVAPYQPRLDWQMWFAALGSYRQNPWVLALIGRVLQGSPPVLRLLGPEPLHGAKPRLARAVLYEYRFTTSAQRRETGAWWTRRLLGLYTPVASLKAPPEARGAQTR